ncbi:hypothetical protein KQI65_07135 [bacterium]|nr:hypothetical protein [bacterium]
MKFKIKKELIDEMLKVFPSIEYDSTADDAVSQVQTSVDWFLQMPKTKNLRQNSPTAGSIKHYIERQPTGYKGYISEDAALIAAIICGFSHDLDSKRIALDYEYYQTWYKVNTTIPDTMWTFLYWGK